MWLAERAERWAEREREGEKERGEKERVCMCGLKTGGEYWEYLCVSLPYFRRLRLLFFSSFFGSDFFTLCRRLLLRAATSVCRFGVRVSSSIESVACQ